MATQFGKGFDSGVLFSCVTIEKISGNGVVIRELIGATGVTKTQAKNILESQFEVLEKYFD